MSSMIPNAPGTQSYYGAVPGAAPEQNNSSSDFLPLANATPKPGTLMPTFDQGYTPTEHQQRLINMIAGKISNHPNWNLQYFLNNHASKLANWTFLPHVHFAGHGDAVLPSQISTPQQSELRWADPRFKLPGYDYSYQNVPGWENTHPG